jgi:hypothetical protein
MIQEYFSDRVGMIQNYQVHAKRLRSQSKNISHMPKVGHFGKIIII